MEERETRYDVYSVSVEEGEPYLAKIMEDVGAMVAQIISGVAGDDFSVSLSFTEWVGTCPEWNSYLPVVVTPNGRKLTMEQFEFVLDTLFDPR